jgi:hypothetical protein
MGLTLKDLQPEPEPVPEPEPEWARLVVTGSPGALTMRLAGTSLLEPGVYRLVKEV